MADFYYFFKNYFRPLKEISYDKDKKEYLCECNTERLDFDDFVSKNYKPTPSSVDTIFFNEKEKKIYLVEFKNQKCSEIENNEIKKKIKDTIQILKDFSKKCNVKFSNYVIYAAVVYNDKPKWRRGICANTIQFGLEYLKEQNIIRDVKTNDIDWFKKEYLRIKNLII